MRSVWPVRKAWDRVAQGFLRTRAGQWLFLRVRGLGVRLAHVLDGQTRIANAWGLLPMGVAIFLWAYTYAPRGTPSHPYPPEPAWRTSVMYLAVVIAVVGLFLLLAPPVRRLVIRRRSGETEELVRIRRTPNAIRTTKSDGSESLAVTPVGAGEVPQAVPTGDRGPGWIAMHWVELGDRGLMLCLDPPTLQESVVRDTKVRFWCDVRRNDGRTFVSLRETDPIPPGHGRVGIPFPGGFTPPLPWPLPEGDYVATWRSIDFEDAHLPTDAFKINGHGRLAT